MIDFHSHLLPGIDDGSDSVETSLGMLRMWAEQGFETVCATPHFYADRNTPERFLRRRQEAYETLREAMEAEGLTIRLLLGAEVRFFDGISRAQDLSSLCLEDSDLLLLEMPFTSWSDRMLSEVDELSRRGFLPVAAHIERYLSLNSGKTIRRFMDMDVLIQCNAEFFLSRRTQRKALRMLKQGQVHFLGSDAHNLRSRQPNLGPAMELIERKLGDAALADLLQNEQLIPLESETPV